MSLRMSPTSPGGCEAQLFPPPGKEAVEPTWWLCATPAPTIVLTVLNLLHRLLAALVDFVSPRARLAAENLLLRQQLVILRRTARRPRFKPWERRLLSLLAVQCSALQNAILVVKPATLLR
jgi:hypothetical protein